MLACTQKTFIKEHYGRILYDYEVYGYSYKEITLADKIIEHHKELLIKLKIPKINKISLVGTNDILMAIDLIETEKKEELSDYYTMDNIDKETSNYEFTGICRYCSRKLLDGGNTWECVCGYGFTKGFNEMELSMLMDDF